MKGLKEEIWKKKEKKSFLGDNWFGGIRFLNDMIMVGINIIRDMSVYSTEEVVQKKLNVMVL